MKMAAAGWILALALSACGDDRTLLTVEIHADRDVPEGLDRLCVTVRPDQGAVSAFGYDVRGESFGDRTLPGLPATIVFEDKNDAFDQLVVTGTGTWQGLPAGFGAGQWSLVDHDQRNATMRVHACGPDRIVPFSLEGPVATLDPTTAGPRRAVLADLDADGRAELIEAPARVVLLSSREPLDVTSNFLLAPPLGAIAVATGDLDHDCAPDVLLGNDESIFPPLVSAPDGAGPFRTRGQDDRVGWPSVAGGAFAIGDLDGTGAADVFIAGAAEYRVLRANVPREGSVSFGNAPSYVTFDAPAEGVGTAVALADLTADGIVDAVVGHAGVVDARHVVRVFEGRNDTLAEVRDALPLPDVRDVVAMAVGPLDGDDTPDVLVVLAGGGEPVATLYVHDADASEPRFARAASPVFPNGEGRDVALVDLDGDCDLDVVLAIADGPSLVFEQTDAGLVRTDIELPPAIAVAAGPSSLGPDAELTTVVILLDAEGGGAIYRAGVGIP